MKNNVSNFEQDIKNYSEKLMTELKNGGSKEFKEFLKFSSNFRKYSMNNRILISIQNPNATQVAGFNAWKKVGRFVKKGEKALTILAPTFVPRKVKNDQGIEEKKLIMIGTRPVKVFDLSQTSGNEIPKWSIRPEGEDDKGLYDALTKEVVKLGFSVEETSLEGGTLGVFYRKTKLIQIEKSQGQVAKFLTLIHEIAHGLLHGTEEGSRMSKEDKECQAEATAYIVACNFGLESVVSAEYLMCWKNFEKELQKNLDLVFKASEQILGLLVKETQETNEINNEQEIAEAA